MTTLYHSYVDKSTHYGDSVDFLHAPQKVNLLENDLKNT